MTTAGRAGRVVRVNGPLVEVDDLDGVRVADVIEVGESAALGEVMTVAGSHATVQMFEYTGGTGPGSPARDPGRALSIPLGPGLLGGIFDGLLRPLELGPEFLGTGWGAQALGPPERTWRFTPSVEAGQQLDAGARLGTVTETHAVEHHIMLPPGQGGEVEWVTPAGEFRVDEVIACVGGTEIRLAQWWPVRRPRPVRERLRADTPLRTGQRVLDVLFPIARGSTAAVPGGFGTGKTLLLQQIAKWCEADVIVYVGCGERGNEMADLLDEFPALDDPRTGRSLMERTVIIVNTSNMPVMAREASVYTGITVAEYYRDMGYNTVVIADSISRWAQALREFATRTGELPAEEGYPARLASALADFYERAGHVQTLAGDDSSTTIIGAVSPAGGDKTEPVTSHTQRFVRCFWSLDRTLASARHYPAVGWEDSFSRDATVLAGWHTSNDDPAWAVRRARLRSVLSEADQLESMVQLLGWQALPDRERVTLTCARLIRDATLQQSALEDNDAFCGPDKERALVEAVLDVDERAHELAEAGVPATLIEEVDLTPLMRARSDAGTNETAAVTEARDIVLAQLGELA